MENRYQRHLQLNEVGPSGQEKIRKSSVLVVGAGGLGCPALQYLTAAGVGLLGIMDPDVVSPSNLQRQILFTENDLGKNKATCAKAFLSKINSEVEIIDYPFALTHENSEEQIAKFDLVIDGTDNFYTRYLISDQCLLLDKVMVYGALYKFEGQVTVFNYKNGPSYRCLFPSPPKMGAIPNCSEIGVLGVVPGIIGIYQATEALKIILEIGDILSGKLLCVNLLNHNHTTFNFPKNSVEIDAIKKQQKVIPIENQDCFVDFELSLDQLSSKKKILWIDVREKEESPRIAHLNVKEFPLSKQLSLEPFHNSEEQIIVFCQTGLRGKLFVQKLRELGIQNCFSLKEGAAELSIWAEKNKD